MKLDLKKIPKALIIFLALLIVFLILLYSLFIPTISNISTYNNKHTEAKTQIAQYENVISNQTAYQAEIDKLDKQYKDNLSIYINVQSSIDDLQKMFKESNIKMTNLTRSAATKDSLNRTSKSGFPLYYTTLNFSFESDIDTTKNIIHYLEQDSIGCYFINTLSMTPVEGSKNYSCRFNVTLYYFDTDQVVTTKAATTATSK
jgi:hypothetical protein